MKTSNIVDISNTINHSSIYYILKPLISFLTFFGLCRPLTSKNKAAIVIYIICVLLQIWMLIISFWKSIICLLGSEISAKTSNISLYIIGIFSALTETSYFAYGLFYSPKRFEQFLKFSDELQGDPIFNVDFGKLRRNIKIFVVTTLVGIAILFIVMVFTILPWQDGGLSCFFSPYFPYRVEHWIHILSVPVLSTFVMSQTIGIFGLTTVLCYMIRRQLDACNTEMKKMMTSKPTIKKLDEIRKRYFRIYKYTELSDDILTPLISTIITMNFLIVCLFANALIYGTLGVEKFTYAAVMVFCVFEITYVLIQCTVVTEKGKTCLETAVFLEVSLMDDKTIPMVTLFIENMKSVDLGFTFLKLFAIDKSAIISIFGSLITYIIVVIQLKPT